jgi:hypothetical protein
MARSPEVVEGRLLVVPYVTMWSGEREPAVTIVERRGGGIGYARENLLDRDERGVLWTRWACSPGRGRPQFGLLHTMRQRRAMIHLLCQVCGEPADRDADGGVLWLRKDHRTDWPDWPEGMRMPEPPVCRPCVGQAVRLCPALRHGAVAVRVREFPIIGVWGTFFRRGPRGPVPVKVTNVNYADPLIGWVQANHLIREVRDCTLIDLDELAEVGSCPS